MKLNLSGRTPDELPDKETIDDILLDIKDTNQFNIHFIKLTETSQNQIISNWQFQSKQASDWVQCGEVSVMKIDYNPTSFDYTDSPIERYATAKEIKYRIIRAPIRLKVVFSDFFILNSEIINESKETYLRLKDYLGIDILQDQFYNGDFTIDFMLSKCVVGDKIPELGDF